MSIVFLIFLYFLLNYISAANIIESGDIIMRERLKKLRKENHLSQAEFAKQLNVHQTAVSQWEQGRTMPDMQTLVKISQLFSVSTDYLLGKTDEKEIEARNSELFVLNDHEKELVIAYRNKKPMQPAVDRLLDLPPDDAETAAYIAARGQNAGGATVQLNKEEIEKLRSVKESDEDF